MTTQKPILGSYLEKMRAHVDEGGRLSHLNGVHLLAEVERLSAATPDVRADVIEECIKIVENVDDVSRGGCTDDEQRLWTNGGREMQRDIIKAIRATEELRALANQDAPTRDGETPCGHVAQRIERSEPDEGRRDVGSTPIVSGLTTTLAANSARVECLEAALRDHGAAMQMLMAQLIVNDAEHPANVRIIDQRIPASVYDKALSAANTLAALQQSPPQGGPIQSPTEQSASGLRSPFDGEGK